MTRTPRSASTRFPLKSHMGSSTTTASRSEHAGVGVFRRSQQLIVNWLDDQVLER